MDSMFLFMYFYYCCLFSFTTWKTVKYGMGCLDCLIPIPWGFQDPTCFEQEFGPGTLWGPFQLDRFVTSRYIRAKSNFFVLICKVCAHVMYETLGLKFEIVDNKAVPETFQYDGQLKLYLFIKYIKFIKKQALSSHHSFSLMGAFLLFLPKGLSPSFFFFPFFVRCGSILLEIVCIWQHTAT